MTCFFHFWKRSPPPCFCVICLVLGLGWGLVSAIFSKTRFPRKVTPKADTFGTAYKYSVFSNVARILLRGRPQWRHKCGGGGVRGHAPPEMYWILGLWNDISCILRARLSKIYRFEIPFLTVCPVKNNVSHVPRGGEGGAWPHAKYAPPKYATERFIRETLGWNADRCPGWDQESYWLERWIFLRVLSGCIKHSHPIVMHLLNKHLLWARRSISDKDWTHMHVLIYYLYWC